MRPLEPSVAIAATPRAWAQRLHRHVADHGGARVRATVLHPRDLDEEDFEVFCADDVTSFLTPALVDAVHRRGRAVLGVYDAEDERGKGELLAMGIDAVVELGAPAEELLSTIQGLASLVRHDDRGAAVVATGPPSPAAPRGALVAVGGPVGGVGATEVAIELARGFARGGRPVALVDGDDHAPGLAPRLGIPQYPNVRVALDDLRGGNDPATALNALTPSLTALPGLASARDAAELRPGDLLAVAGALTNGRHAVVVNVGSCLDDTGGAGRYAQTREVLGAADVVVAVAAPTPSGLARLAEWLADVAALPRRAPAHVVVNQAPAGSWQRGQILGELARCCVTASTTLVPFDRLVADAAWDGGPVARGAFTRAIGRLADELAPALAGAATNALPAAGGWS